MQTKEDGERFVAKLERGLERRKECLVIGMEITKVLARSMFDETTAVLNTTRVKGFLIEWDKIEACVIAVWPEGIPDEAARLNLREWIQQCILEDMQRTTALSGCLAWELAHELDHYAAHVFPENVH